MSSAQSPAPEVGTSLARDAWLRFKKNKIAMAGATVVVFMAVCGYSAPLVAQYVTHFSLDEQHTEFKLMPPGTADISKDHCTFDGDKSHFNALDIDQNGVIGGAAELRALHQTARFLLFLFDDYDLVPGDEKPSAIRKLKRHPDGFLNPSEYPANWDELEETFRDEFVDAMIKLLPQDKQSDYDLAEDMALARWTALALDRDKAFALMDTDKNGYLNRTEVDDFRLRYRLFESVTWALAEMDGNNDGNITPDEYPGLPVRHTFWLGTDHLGRDVLTRLFYGARISITIALLATFVSFLIGVSWGSIAGYYGGRVDSVMMRIVDVLYGLPFMFIVILLIVIFGRSTINLFIALGAVQWLTMSRVVRGQVISLKTREFVEAAVAIGVPRIKIVFKHLLRNTVGPVIVYSTLMVPAIILEEAFLSFLGLGVQPPDPSWGNMITDGAKVMDTFPWLILYPGFVLSLTLFSMNFVGDGLRDALDPQMQKS